MQDQRSSPAGKIVLWGLVAINALLLVIVLNRYIKPTTALAQGMAPGDYMVSPGVLAGQADGVLVVLDTRNGLLSIIGYNSVSGQLGSSPPIDVARLMQSGVSPKRR